MNGYTRTTINYGWKTYSTNYKCTCDVCGKSSTKHISFGVNNMASNETIEARYAVLKLKASDLSKVKETCTSCLNKKFAGEFSIIDFPSYFTSTSEELLQQYQETEKSIKDHVKDMNKKFKGLVVLYKEEEFVLDEIYFDLYYGDIKARISGINKIKKWITKDRTEYVNIDKILFTSELFESRANKI